MLTFLLESAVRSLGLGIVVWIAMGVFRVRTPQSRSLAWTTVLLSSLTMPLLMPAMEAAMTSAPQAAVSWIPAVPASPFLEPLPPATADTPSPVDWLALISIAYVAVAAVFLLRMLVGLLQSRRLWKAAVPLNEPWTSGNDVRVSNSLGVPVTYGSTILFPADWPEWSVFKRRAVLLHESSHVRRRDFHVQFAANLHRAVFWFSPLAWWLQKRLVEFAETACDDAAIREVEDRVSYAEILVDLAARNSGSSYVGVAMARGKTVEGRVERILRETRIAATPSLIRRILMVAALVPLAGLAAGSWLLQAQTTMPLRETLVASLLPQQNAPAPAPPQQPTTLPAQPPQAREAAQYLAAWPEQEVPEIITNEEREAFNALLADMERERFVEQFWLRRDPTPGTTDNEYREEYYGRIARANEKYTRTGVPGWRTDRGRTLIRYGEPDEIETHAIGGTYIRDASEGGGRTVTFPFERWRYRFIQGLGNNIILEFVDTALDGSYRLTYDPREKDALLNPTGADR